MPRRDSMDAHQKLSLGVVAAIGITALVFAVFQMRRAVMEPLDIENPQHFKTAQEVKAEQIAALKEQDTDSDKLNDYDELYLFRTSPFLPDSDSDGTDDGVEVAQSTDPNCPAGSTCRTVGTEPSSDTGTTSAVSADMPSLTPSQETILAAMERVFGGVEELTPETMNERLQALSPEELRQFMRDIGVSEEVLSKTDDATMRQLLSETLVDMKKQDTAPLEGNTTGQ